MSKGAKLVLNMVLCLIFACIIIWNANLKMSQEKGLQVSSDANGLIRMAYHLTHSGTYSSKIENGTPLFLDNTCSIYNRNDKSDFSSLAFDLIIKQGKRRIKKYTKK